MRSTKSLATLALAFCATLLGSVGTAAAQPVAAEQRYHYDFDDDYMVGDTLSTTPPLLRIPKRLPRVSLLRPRASFVPEMLKSVESM
jgi:hypothetical protein